MAKSNIIYKDRPTVYAKYYHPQSGGFLEYKSTIQIRDSGQHPIRMRLKFDGIPPSFAPMPPEEHTIKAKDIVDLCLKLKRWFGKYGYELK
ncbi:MAG: hypothetical protein IH892_07175 [Planctomycetes bacterium]|nr:hypothetical protein [Planctomycetota bacterium]